MAKKKAAVKQQDSKKSVQKKKQQVLEDKTFGLKNKNKSKKVQSQIKSIEKSVMNSGDPKLRKMEEQRKKAKAEAKARKKQMEEERNALFGEALLAVQKKSHRNANQKDGKVEAKGRDADADDSKKTTSRAMKMMYQMDAQEMSEKLKEDVSSSFHFAHESPCKSICMLTSSIFVYLLFRPSQTMYLLWRMKSRCSGRRRLPN